MSILWIDGFGVYGKTASLMLNGPYAQVQNITLVDDPDPTAVGSIVPRIPNTSINSSPNLSSTSLFRRVFPAARQTVGFGFRIWMENLPNTAAGNILSFSLRDAGNIARLDFVVGSTGVIYVYRGSFIGGSATKIGETPVPVLTANAWQHIEVKATADSLAGEVEIRVEGVTVLTLSGVDTGSSDFAQINWAFFQQFNNPGQPKNAFYVKDLVAWDTLGSYNTNFLGSVSIVVLRPDSDVSLNWTPIGAADGFSILDNNPPNDAAYIEADTTPPAPYEATLSNLPPDVTGIRAVQTTVRARKTDGGDGNLQSIVVSGVATQGGADRPVSTAFTFYNDIFEEDPATSAPWTPSAVDALQVRLNRTV